MTTIINQVVTAITAALQSAPAVADSIGRVNLRPVSQAVAQAVVVRPVQSEVTQAGVLNSMPVSWSTTVAVECYARSSGATTPDQSVDALLESVYARLMADPTLSGVVLGLQPQHVSFDFDADGDKTACATIVFNARQRASAGSLS